jgi:hypothetical protein
MMGMKLLDILVQAKPIARRFTKLTLDFLLWVEADFILMINSLKGLADCRKLQVHFFMTSHSLVHTESCFCTALISVIASFYSLIDRSGRMPHVPFHLL